MKKSDLRRVFMLAVLLLLVCTVCTLPAAAADTAVVHTFDELKNNIALETSTIVIDQDIEITEQLIIDWPKDITLTVPDGQNHRLTRANSLTDSLFSIGGDSKLTIKDNGSGILTLDGMSVPNSQSLVLVKNGGQFIMSGGNLTNNTASNGGAIFLGSWGGSDNATFIMQSGTISGNTASSLYGGGVYLQYRGDFSMSGGSIRDNTASHNADGGGVAVGTSSTFTMSGGSITGNTARNGGGISAPDSTATVIIRGNAEISQNTATGYGGGIHVSGATVVMESDGIISNNMQSLPSGQGGGGVLLEQGAQFLMKGGTITGNTASGFNGGGGILSLSGKSITMSDGKISQNSAKQGGGVSLLVGKFSMSGGTITDNTATATSGGGVYLKSVNGFEMSGDAAVSDNQAKQSGGGVAVAGPFVMSGTASLTGNTAPTGGELQFSGGSVTLTDTASIKPNETYLGNTLFLTVGSAGFTGLVGNITSAKTDAGTKLIALPTGAIKGDYEKYFTLSPAMMLPQKKSLNYVLTGSSPGLHLAEVYHLTPPKTDHEEADYPAGEEITLNANIPQGMMFAGWIVTGLSSVTDAQLKETPITFVMPANEVTCTATFKEAPPVPLPPSGDTSGDGNMDNAFRVLFETNGGSDVAPVTGLSYGDRLTAPAAPAKDGYTFDGWYTDEACTKAWSFSATIPGDMTLYAKWISGAPVTTPAPTTAATTGTTAKATPAVTQQTVSATTAAPVSTTADVQPTLLQTPAPIAGLLFGLLAAGVLLRRRA